MSFAGLLLSNLLRKRTRTILTLVSLAIAFLLFMLLRAIAAAFAGGVTVAGLDRLIIDARYAMTDNLPLAHVRAVGDLPGVAATAHMSWFGGYYQDPKNTFATYPVDPTTYFDVFSDADVEQTVLDAFGESRLAAVASHSLAAKYGWSPGDAIPLRGDIWPKEDGSWDWTFNLAGTFDPPPGQAGTQQLLIHYDFFNESVADWAKNQVGWIAVAIDDTNSADAIAEAVDSLFRNSSDPTRTTSEDEYVKQFASQIGDIGFISTMILSAVFFTIVLLTGNTASQAFRERIPELAAMKTLGFTDTTVSVLVLGEAVLLCVAGGGAGIALSLLWEAPLNDNLQGTLGAFHMSWKNAALGLGIASVLGLAIGAQPAWAARRLSIVDALRRN